MFPQTLPGNLELVADLLDGMNAKLQSINETLKAQSFKAADQTVHVALRGTDSGANRFRSQVECRIVRILFSSDTLGVWTLNVGNDPSFQFYNAANNWVEVVANEDSRIVVTPGLDIWFSSGAVTTWTAHIWYRFGARPGRTAANA